MSSLLADPCFNLWTHPVGPAVALSGHGGQLGVQEVSGLVDALRGEEYKARSEACRVGDLFPPPLQMHLGQYSPSRAAPTLTCGNA